MNKYSYKFFEKSIENLYNETSLPLTKKTYFSNSIILLIISANNLIYEIFYFNNKEILRDEIICILLIILAMILTYFKPKFINLAVFIINILTAVIGLRRFNFLSNTLEQKKNKIQYGFAYGVINGFIHSNLIRNNNFYLFTIGVFITSCIYGHFFKIQISLKFIIFSIIILESFHFYFLEKFKRKYFLKEKNLLNSSLQWKKLMLEDIPDTLIALLSKKEVEEEIKTDMLKSKNLKKGCSIEEINFISKNSIINEIMQEIKSLEFISSFGLEKFGIKSTKDFLNYLKQIQITNIEENKLMALDSFSNGKDIIYNLNKKNSKKFKNSHFYLGKYLNEKIRILICEINWESTPYFLIKIEKNSLEEEIHQLKELNQYKDQILSSVSHDLRTPINGMNFAIQKIEEISSQDNKQISHYIQWCKTNSTLLLNLINDILDYSQIKAKELRINVSPFNLKKIINEIYNLMNITAEIKGIPLKISFLLEENTIIYSDEGRLKQILINLVSNALKFTKKGFVEIVVSLINKNLIKFDVIDTGIGIKPEIIPKLTKPFATFDNDEGINKNGIGYFIYEFFFFFFFLVHFFFFNF